MIALASCRKPTAEEHIKKGDDFLAKSSLQEAILEYRLAVQADPKRADAHTKLADAYLASNTPTSALQEYVRAADLLPNDAAAQIRAGTFLLAASAFEDAKSRADRALTIAPSDTNAQILRGNALAGLHDLDGALAEFQEAISLNPNAEAAYTSLGTLQYTKGEKAEAETAFRKAVSVAPKSVAARLALGNFLWSSGRLADAESVFKEALTLEPSNTTANRVLGLFLVRAGRAPEAELYFKTIAASTKDAQAQLSLSDYYVLMKRYDEARKILDRMAAQKETFGIANTRLAALDATQGNLPSALARAADVIKRDPSNLSARLLNTRLLLLDGKRDAALTEANGIVARDPNGREAPHAHEIMGGIYATIGRRDDAIHEYEEALKGESQPVAVLLALAQLHLSAGRADRAGDAVQQALSIAPDDLGTRAMSVRVSMLRGDTVRTRADLAKLQRDFPHSPTVMNLVAADAMNANQPADARAAYQKSMAADPNNLEALVGLTQLDVAAGRADDAVARLDAALKTTTKPTAEFLIVAGQAYAEARQPDRAEALLQQAIDLDPSRLQGYASLGTLYIRQNRLADAVSRFQQIVDRDPRSVSGNTMLGMLFDMQSKTAEAQKQYEKTLTINPRAAVAANNLAWILVSSDGNLDLALQYAQTALQQMPDEPNVNDTIGWIYFKKGFAPQAVRYFEHGISRGGRSADAYYHLGLAYAATGEVAKAKTQLRHALELGKSAPWAADAEKALSSLK